MPSLLLAAEAPRNARANHSACEVGSLCGSGSLWLHESPFSLPPSRRRHRGRPSQGSPSLHLKQFSSKQKAFSLSLSLSLSLPLEGFAIFGWCSSASLFLSKREETNTRNARSSRLPQSSLSLLFSLLELADTFSFYPDKNCFLKHFRKYRSRSRF